MKKFFFIITALVVYQYWGSIYSFISPPPDYAASHGGKVLVYGTSWCKYCAKTRKLLQDNDIPYYEYNIERSTEGYAQHKRLGGVGVPLVLINGEVVKGYNPARILQLANGT
jgi:glutaredoxin